MPALPGPRWPALLLAIAVAGPSAGCGERAAPAGGPSAVAPAVVVPAPAAAAPEPWTGEDPPEKLSAWGLFLGNGASQEPVGGVVPYDVNTPLFSDYAQKYRFVRLPPGKKATYRDPEAFDFPVGTVLVKSFAYPHDERDPGKGRRLIETRLLVHRPDGWKGVPYVWNDGQTEATLEIAGVTKEIRRVGSDGKELTHRYSVPNTNQCIGCHENSRVMKPIGPTARGLNRTFDYPDGRENQIAHWTRVGILEGALSPSEAPRMAVWDDPSTGSLDHRARAWLEANCAHCHNPAGPARTSGLDLRSVQADWAQAGVWKTPVAAGRGSGLRLHDIVPGKPDQSILVYRIESLEPGIMMPELGRRLRHTEGIALVRQWIAEMTDPRVR